MSVNVLNVKVPIGIKNGRGGRKVKYQLMPELSKADYDRLKADIKANCVIYPIIYDSDGNVLDGYNRLKICEELGITDFPTQIQIGLETEQEKRSFARRININRRHLSSKQKREVIQDELIDTEGKLSNNAIAKTLGVSPMTVISVRKEAEKVGLVSNLETITGADGVEQPAKKPRKKKKAEPVAEREPDAEDPERPTLDMVVEETEKEPPPGVVKSTKTFNYQNSDNIEWAKWSWNPFVGCLRGCPYCYAKDIATRFYGDFKPRFFEERLMAPFNTKIPADKRNEPGIRNVFLGSMTDFFGDFIDPDWRKRTLEVVEKTPQWNYLILTKDPEGILPHAPLPRNVWVGTTVDTQARVAKAQEVFASLHGDNAAVTFLSCEPLRSRLEFTDMSMFDWIIIGGQSRSSGTPAAQPEWEWVEELLTQARGSGCKVYFKPNLTARPKEYPERSVKCR